MNNQNLNMKKIITILLLSPMVILMANAQSKISFGPNAGFGTTRISNFEDSKYQPAGNFGVSFVYSAIEHFGVGVDLKYSIEGGKRMYNIGNTSYTQALRANYLRVPVKAIYFFGDFGDRTRPKVAIGPSFGFLLGGNNELETTSSTGSKSVTKTDTRDVYKGFDLGVHASAGLNYRLVKNTWFTTDIAYMHGLTNNAENNNLGISNLKNRNLQLNIGVNFGL
jgi:outer membrane protein W